MLARSPTTTCSAVGSARRASPARLSLRACNVTACPPSASSCAAISPCPSLEPVIRIRDIRTPFAFVCTASLTLILRVDRCAVQAAGRLPERLESRLLGPGELLGAADQPGVGVGSLLLSVERGHIQPERDCAHGPVSRAEARYASSTWTHASRQSTYASTNLSISRFRLSAAMSLTQFVPASAWARPPSRDPIARRERAQTRPRREEPIHAISVRLEPNPSVSQPGSGSPQRATADNQSRPTRCWSATSADRATACRAPH